MSTYQPNADVAVAAFQRGYIPVPIMAGSKRPYGTDWQRTHWQSSEEVEAAFEQWHDDGIPGVGLLLGEPSGGLVDIDLDHPLALRLRAALLPKTEMMHDRVGRPMSHHWFRVTENLPSTRAYKMPDGATIIEIRSTGAQTVIPPSTHPTGEQYRWVGEPWGGNGPATIDGLALGSQVAMIALTAILIEGWPEQGGRHEAYLALAGATLRLRDGIHPWWANVTPLLIQLIAHETHDEEGARTRVKEVMESTLVRLRDGRPATGWTTLGELIGLDFMDRARRLVRDIEAMVGTESDRRGPSHADGDADGTAGEGVPVSRSNVDSSKVSWQRVDLGPYLRGEIVLPDPGVLVRVDEQGLMYPGRVNSLFGRSEAAKSWLALLACKQEIGRNGRAVYLDFEDHPVLMTDRIKRLGFDTRDAEDHFAYVNPGHPIAPLQYSRWGQHEPNDVGKLNASVFAELLDPKGFNPTLIVVDGMTSLYATHGLSTNDAVGTELISSWLKWLTLSGTAPEGRTVVLIDHMGKGEGDGPIGAHHKIAMVQGTALRVVVIDRPAKGRVGVMSLIVAKDRPGAIRALSDGKGKDQKIGKAVLDSTDPDRSSLTIEVPDPNEVDTPEVTDNVLAKATKRSTQSLLQDAMLARFEPPDVVIRAADLPIMLDASAGQCRTARTALMEGGFLERVPGTRVNNELYLRRPQSAG